MCNEQTGKTSFDKYKISLPDSFSAVGAGGWNHVFQIANDPKGKLVDQIVKGIKSGQAPNNGEVEALVDLLEVRFISTVMCYSSCYKQFKADPRCYFSAPASMFPPFQGARKRFQC
jgi:hypothetical protein